LFQKVKQKRIFHEVADQIEEAVVSGLLKPGEKLPAERELVGRFDISRRTLREALRIVEQKGLIEIKIGSRGGAFVKDLTTAPISESLALLIRSKKVSLRELAEFRVDIESLVAAKAARQATREDIESLKDLLVEGENILASKRFNWKAFMEVDQRLHRALARIARNSISEFILKTIHENINRYYESYLPKDKEIWKQSFLEMRPLVKAVEDGDAQKAFILAQEHIKRGDRLMENVAIR
jgi:GntR family transcriptional repressor for pyruvate dehydrogenase complex